MANDQDDATFLVTTPEMVPWHELCLSVRRQSETAAHSERVSSTLSPYFAQASQRSRRIPVQ